MMPSEPVAPEGYSPLVHVAVDHTEYRPQPGDHVEIYGPGKVVLERDGHIVAVAEKIVWKRPELICPLKGSN